MELIRIDPDVEDSHELLQAVHHTTCPMSLMTRYTKNLPDAASTTHALASYMPSHMSSEAMQHKAAWEPYASRFDPTPWEKTKRPQATDDGDYADGSHKKRSLRQKGNGKGRGKGKGKTPNPAHTQKGQAKGQDASWWEPSDSSNQAGDPWSHHGHNHWHTVTYNKRQNNHPAYIQYQEDVTPTLKKQRGSGK